jgi:hypothetical protein
MLGNQIKLGTLILILSTGCAPGIPPVAEKKGEQVTNSETSHPPQGTARAAEAKQATGGAAEKAPGMIIYIDPKTGEILPGPPADWTPLQDEKSTTGPLPEPQVVPSPVPGGGVMIELDDRFRTPLKATVGPDGKVIIKHESEKPAASEKK